jgi:hypothetical protein
MPTIDKTANVEMKEPTERPEAAKIVAGIDLAAGPHVQ